jgi:hypothetical protein
MFRPRSKSIDIYSIMGAQNDGKGLFYGYVGASDCAIKRRFTARGSRTCYDISAKYGDWPLRGQAFRVGSTSSLEERADFLLELIARAYGIDAG